MQLATAQIHRNEIIDRVAQGHRITDIAKDIGCSQGAISQQLANDPEYIAAMTTGLESKMDQREDELEGASDGLMVARARELLSHARWRAERLRPSIYGQQRQAVQVNTTGSTQINVVSWADAQGPEVLNITPVVSSTDSTP